jgi:hypothetical protein
MPRARRTGSLLGPLALVDTWWVPGGAPNYVSLELQDAAIRWKLELRLLPKSINQQPSQSGPHILYNAYAVCRFKATTFASVSRFAVIHYFIPIQRLFDSSTDQPKTAHLMRPTQISPNTM